MDRTVTFAPLVPPSCFTLLRVRREKCPWRRKRFRFLQYDVERTYSVMQADFASFARRVTFWLENTNLSVMCGLKFVRFYVSSHGMRLTKKRAETFLNETIHVDHTHVDVVQLHRADNLAFDDGTNDAIAVGKGRELKSFFSNAVKFGNRLQFYRTGFCASFGYLAYYASPNIRDNIVTHIQVYNSAAKMARTTDSGFLPSFAICRGYSNSNQRLRNVTNEARQYVRDLLQYCNTYFIDCPTTRCEEVFTFDFLRVETSLSEAFKQYRVFDKTELNITTKEFLCRNIFYRFCNWRRHFDNVIGDDLCFLRKLIVDRNLLDGIKFIIAVYATWAYTHVLQNVDARQTTRSQMSTIELYNNYEDAFSTDRLVRECEATGGKFTVRVANRRVRARDVYNAIAQDACSEASHVCASIFATMRCTSSTVSLGTSSTCSQ